MKVHPSFVARRLNAAREEAVPALAELAGVWSGRARLSEAGVLTGLSPAETAAHLALWYTGEVGNGGHTQYYMNPWGAHAHETVSALERLGLQECACILGDSFQVFPGGLVPRERAVRLAVIEALDSAQQDLLDDCDRALWAIAIGVDADILEYLRQHKDQVLAPERA